MEEIALKVAGEFGVDSGELYRKHATCRVARSVFMELCRIYLTWKMSLTDIGRRLDGVTVDAISQNSRRLSEKMKNDHDLEMRFQKLMNLLAQKSK